MVRTGVEVTGLRIAGRWITALRTSQGEVEGESFVLATGWWSKSLGARLGLRVPVLGGKGYATDVEDLQLLHSEGSTCARPDLYRRLATRFGAGRSNRPPSRS